MNSVMARLVAASIPARTEGDVRAAHRTLQVEVERWHRRGLPAPEGLFTAYKTTVTYLNSLDGVAA